MTTTSASRLADALRALHPDRPATVEALRPLYCTDIDFRDPIQHIHGLDAFIAMNYRLLKRARDLSFDVTSAVGEGDTVFLAWTMTAVPKLGPRIAVDGTTRATFRDGKVAVHRDFWDVGELVASAIPFGQAALHLLLKPLA